MNRQELEDAARDLQVQIWAQKKILWPEREPHPFDALDPGVAAQVLGINFELVDQLKFALSDERYETAGILDRPRKKIAVATRFGPQVTRFTGAHEIAHWICHPREVSLHRDRPVEGIERNAREPREQEADYFAACFLMPRRLVTHLFHDMFLTRGEPFVFNETTLYNLGTNEVDALLYPDVDSHDREVALARTRAFGRRTFEKSLSEMFQVSIATMAIRIRELGLIRAWP